MTVRPIRNMVNHETNELFFDNLEIPAENLIGEEGQGFRYILDGLNAERTLIAAECIGDGYWFIDRVDALCQGARGVRPARSARTRACSSRSPRAYIEVEAANLMRWKACELFDAHQPCGAEANMAKYLAAKASLGGGQRLPADPRRLRLRLRIRRRAQVPRDAAVPGGADLDQPDPVATWPSTCWACRGRSERCRDAPARRHHRRHARARDRRAVLHAPAGRPRRARDQDRAPRQRRLRPRLRQPRQRPGLALRLDQPLQGKPDARPQARRGAGAVLEQLLAKRRRAGAEPGARRGGAHGPVVRGAAASSTRGSSSATSRATATTAPTATRRPTTC